MPDRLVLVSGRVLPATVERLDRIAAELGKRRPGEVVKRADALRVALDRGVDIMEHELGLLPPAEPRTAAKRGPRTSPKPARPTAGAIAPIPPARPAKNGPGKPRGKR